MRLAAAFPMCAALAAILLAALPTSAAAAEQQWGLVAIDLGPAIKARPSLTSLTEWEDSAAIDRFFQASGDHRLVTPIKARLAWDEANLYALFICDDPDQLAPEDAAGRKLQRSDSVSLYVQKTNQNDDRNYTRFTVNANKTHSAAALRASGGASSLNGGYQVAVRATDTGWIAQLDIPWWLVGGRPTGPFGIQLIRRRSQSGDIASPAGLDIDVNFVASQDTVGSFIEARLGGKPRLHYGAGALATLPSGTLRWQRPALLAHLSPQEQAAIARLQSELSQPTTAANFAERVQLAQRWQDLLMLEGFSFRSQPGMFPWGDPRNPWDDRAEINRLLARGDFAQAYKLLDQVLSYYDQVTRYWFADGSPGNVKDQAWLQLAALNRVECSEHEVALHFSLGAKEVMLYLSSPVTGGVRLRGEQVGPRFLPSSHRLSPVAQTGSTRKFVSPETEMTIALGDNWSIAVSSLARPDKSWQIGKDDLRFAVDAQGAIRAIDLWADLQPGEAVYGLGERFEALNLRGRVVTLWQQDAWEGNIWGIRNHAYKNIPLWHSSRGYSVFWNSTYRLRADLGVANAGRSRFTSSGPILDLHVWLAEPVEAVKAYSRLTGMPVLPPRWAFETWIGGTSARWRNGPMKNAAAEIMNVVRKFAELDIPHSTIYPEGGKEASLYEWLKKAGLHIVAWTSTSFTPSQVIQALPGIRPDQLPFLKFEGLSAQQRMQMQTLLDFTHPHALSFLRKHWKPWMDKGQDGMMIDFGDLVPVEAVAADGRRGGELHNAYLYEYAKTHYQLFQERYGDEFVLLARGGAPGMQSFATTFAGDHPANFVGFNAAMRGGLNLAASGIPIWGDDTGGFRGFSEEECYLRWVEWSTFKPLMRFHGHSPKEPWNYSDQAVAIYKHYVWVRQNLLDYIYSAAIHTHLSGEPMMQPMHMAFPELPGAADIDDQYMFGPDLLVAPMNKEGDSRLVTLPPGRWTHLWSGRTFQGPAVITAKAPLDEIPVYLRAGAVLPVEFDEGLNWGASMSARRVKALVVAQPLSPTSSHYYETPTARAEFRLQPTEHGFTLETAGRPATRYIVFYGVAAAQRIIVDGRELPKLQHISDLSKENGWVEEGNRIMLGIWEADAHKIEVCTTANTHEGGAGK